MKSELPETVECSVTFSNSLISERILVPIPRDQIVTNLEGGSGGKERSVDRLAKSQELYIGKYCGKYRLTKVEPGIETKFDYKVPFYPSHPLEYTSFLIQCLENGERYTQWQAADRIQQIIFKQFEGLDKKQITDRDAAETIGVFVKNKLRYSRVRTKYKFIDELVLTPEDVHPREDCLGYHAAFVGCLRAWEIPAVVDVGFRLTRQDDPHTWAWFFDRQKQEWQSVDLNDNEKNVSFGFYQNGRVSMTLGTTHDIINVDNFPDSVASFIQYGFGESVAKKLPPHTSAKFNIAV